MCGITGIVNASRDRKVDESVVRAMCQRIHHRGPDDSGVWFGAGVGIGMTRLAIIDVAHGAQPMFNEDGSVAIVFNGEIYNHSDLRVMLEQKGHRFRTHADTEVIVHLYEEFGQECVRHLRGMFAFAVWDSQSETLFVARDRLGIKPVYYCQEKDRLVIASEIKSILAVPGVRASECAEALTGYMAYGYVPAPLSMFAGILKLPAGHWLSYRRGDLTVKSYWDVEYRPDRNRTEKQTVDDVIEILDEAVRIRLMSEVPLGAFLSGGTDSSVVVGLMARHMKEPVKTFSIGFDIDKYNELGYARAVAAHFETEHHERMVTANALEVMPALVDQFDEPFSDSSAIPTYYLSRATREHVTVALSGDGGDELFAGYHRFYNRPHERIASRVPVALRRLLLSPVASALPEEMCGVDYLRDIIGTADEQYTRRITGGVSTTFDRMYSGRVIGLVSADPARFVRPFLDRVVGADELSRRQYVDTKMFMCDDILTKVDRASMLVSLEVRVPLIDHLMVEYAATIPPAMHRREGRMKHILKKVAERLMPESMVNRPKSGFAIPLGEWIRGEWNPLAHELVLGARARARNNFDERFLRRVIDEHDRGRRDNGTMIWRLMMLELWYRRKLEGDRASLRADG